VGRYRAIAEYVARIFGNDRQGYRRVKTALERRKISIVISPSTISARIRVLTELAVVSSRRDAIGASAADFFANPMVTPVVRVASRQENPARKISKFD